ncbi:MAG TPA: cytochrome c biogenesis protein CcdA [Actinomycetota bacterium]|nr:cytochrome c biogenesis protein CcdA [Actinomycetota bacterium]
MADPTVPIAFAAGFVSFLSPCVLPLVPGYLSFMSGFATTGETPSAREAVVPATAFVAGFTAVFVALGATATLLGAVLRDHQTLLSRIGGVFIIVLGLIFMNVIKIPWLYREARFHPTPKAGMWGSVVLGATFAFGWSPCIGATMGAVLTMAAGGGVNGGVGEGAFLLAVYSLGLGLPFILAGLGVARLTSTLAWLRKHIRTVNLASGVMLIIVGLLFLTGRLFELSIWMQRGLTRLDLDFWSF